MKLKHTRTNNVPVLGDRSLGYFGITALMSQDYFITTRDRIAGPARPDPRIKFFCSKEQFSLRKNLIEAGVKFDRSMVEIEDEWQVCIKASTKAATEYVRLSTNILAFNLIPYDSCHIEIVKSAYKVGRRTLEGQVAPRVARESEWLTRTFPEFDFADNKREVIYVFQQAIHSKQTNDRKVYKIGKTHNFAARNSSHKTSNTDLVLITIIEASDIITESAIHKLFTHSRLEREWFLLNQEQVNILLSRSKLTSALTYDNTTDN